MSQSTDIDAANASPPSAGGLVRFVVLGFALLCLGIWLGHMGGFSPRSHPILDQQGMTAASTQAIGRLVGFVLILLDALGPLAIIWLGATGLGWPIRVWMARDARCPILTQAGTGLALLLLANYLLAWAGLLNTITAWGLPALGVALLIAQLAIYNRQQPLEVSAIPVPAWPALLAAPAVGMMLVAAACPPGTMWAIEANGYDVLSYHLQLPQEWLALGAMQGLEHNVYSYLPSLVEAQSMAIGAMRGSMYQGIYTTQLFQASCALYAACALAGMVGHIAPRAAAACAGAVLLVTPWTLILGSMAYNEMTTLALAAGAWLILFDSRIVPWRAAIIAGAMLGLATLAKLTAGPNLLAPTVIITAMGLHRWFAKAAPNAQPSSNIRSHLRDAAVLAIVAALFISPYLARNASWTGNPVFPFATSIFGSGHWTQEQVERWQAAHYDPVDSDAVTGLARQWLLNAGYGALGGRPTTRTAENIAQFTHEFGLPTLWLAVLLATLALFADRRHPLLPPLRSVALAMLLILAMQMLFWLFGTHHQSRFMAFSLLPGSILVALGAAWLWHRGDNTSITPSTAIADTANNIDQPRPTPRAFIALATALLLTMTLGSFIVMQRQSLAGYGDGPMPVWFSVDTLPQPHQLPTLEVGQVIAGDHPMNHIRSTGEIWLIADASRMLYIRKPNRYSSAFDHNPLGNLIREVGSDPHTLIAALHQRNVTHLWVHWSELARLRNTYGYDPDITEPLLRNLINAGLHEHPLTAPMPTVSLLVLPPRQRAPLP